MIIIATQCFPPKLGGIESLIATLAQGFIDAGKNVIVLADGSPDAIDQSAPYPVYRFAGPKPWRRWRKRWQLKHLLVKHPNACLLTDSWKSAAYLAPIMQSQPGRCVCLAHGNDVLTQNNPQRQQRITHTLAQVNAVIAVSHYTAGLVKKLSDCAISVIGNPVAPAPPIDKTVLAQYQQQFKDATPILLTIARLEPRKGHDQVIAALPALRQDFPKLCYLIAGTGKDRDRLSRLVAQHQLADCVHFIGNVDDTHKHALYQLADCFVMPVRDDQAGHSVEGFGISYLEAASHSLPVLAGQSGGARDAVIDGKTGRCVNGEDTTAVQTALAELLNQANTMKQLGQAGKQYAANHFGIAKVIKAYLAVLMTEA